MSRLTSALNSDCTHWVDRRNAEPQLLLLLHSCSFCSCTTPWPGLNCCICRAELRAGMYLRVTEATLVAFDGRVARQENPAWAAAVAMLECDEQLLLPPPPLRSACCPRLVCKRRVNRQIPKRSSAACALTPRASSALLPIHCSPFLSLLSLSLSLFRYRSVRTSISSYNARAAPSPRTHTHGRGAVRLNPKKSALKQASDLSFQSLFWKCIHQSNAASLSTHPRPSFCFPPVLSCSFPSLFFHSGRHEEVQLTAQQLRLADPADLWNCSSRGSSVFATNGK